MRCLLFASYLLSSYPALAQHAKPRVLYQHNPATFTTLSDGFNPELLIRCYRVDLRLSALVPNLMEATQQDSILLVATLADRLTLHKALDYTELRQASITSSRLSFGGMRVGTSQVDFCRRLHLSPAYDAYSFLRTGELFEQITCFFAGGQLQRIEYKHPTDLSKFR